MAQWTIKDKDKDSKDKNKLFHIGPSKLVTFALLDN